MPILTSSKTEGVILQEEHFGRKQQHDITGYNILPRNYCTYRNRSDGVDFTFNINKCCDKGIISKFYPVFSGNNSDVFFLSLVLNNSEEVVHEIAYTCTGTGQKVLSFLDLQKMKVRVPSFDEQKKIAAYFDDLDHLITLHQRKCMEVEYKSLNDWEQRKLGSILISLQNNTLSRADLSNETGVAKNVHYGDVLIKFGEVLDVSKEQLPMILNEDVLTKYKTSFLQNGDVIIADTAEDTTVGKCSEIVGLNDEVVLSGLHTIPYRPIEKFASGYLGYYLNSSAYHNQLIPLMQGIKVTSISKSAMQDTDIIYPKSKEEQASIGEYFMTLDTLITLHQRKCMEVEYKSLNDWEQRKVSEMCSIATGKSNTQDKIEDGEYPFYVRSPIIERSNKYLYDEEAVLTVGDGVGTGKVFHYVNGKYDLHQRCYRMYDFSDRLNAKYFFQVFSKMFYRRVMAMTAKTSVDSVRMEMIADMEIPVPSIEEQVQISRYLEDLDHLITLHQRKYFYATNITKCIKNDIIVYKYHNINNIIKRDEYKNKTNYSIWKGKDFMGERNSIEVYHGSGEIIYYPEIRKTKYTKDFSWGFYCTKSYEQAKRWAERKHENGIVNVYRYIEDNTLNIKKFDGMTDEWLDFIAGCRNGRVHDYDIVEGPMADDTIWNFVNDYLNGNISRTVFWEYARFKHPTHQISFHSIRALNCLEYERSEKIDEEL